jgi:hypothetical protein
VWEQISLVVVQNTEAFKPSVGSIVVAMKQPLQHKLEPFSFLILIYMDSNNILHHL